MNLPALFRTAWHITWRNPLLWWLNLALLAVFGPAGVLTAVLSSFGVLGQLAELAPGLALPAWATPSADLLTLAGLFALTVGALVVTSAFTWLIQALVMRGAHLAATTGTAPWREVAQLGRERARHVITLSLTFGVVVSVLGLVPVGLRLVWPLAGEALGVVLGPVNVVLGLVLFVAVLAVSVDDLRPQAALGRAGGVLRRGWWVFLLVALLSAAPGVAVLVIAVPVSVVLAVAFVLEPLAGWALVLVCGLPALAVMLALVVGMAVFTSVLYTLAYRALADSATPASPAT